MAGDVTFKNVYNPILATPVLAGLAPINLPVLTHLPKAVGCIYYSTYANAILGASNFVTGIDPVSCSGGNCNTVFLPGSLQLARQLNQLNGTLLNMNATVFNDVSAVLLYNAPGYQLEFFPLEDGFMFEGETHCGIFGKERGHGLFV